MLAGGLLVGLVLLVTISFVAFVPLFVGLLVVAAFTVQLGMGVYYVLTRELAAVGAIGTAALLPVPEPGREAPAASTADSSPDS